jgi:hypothetical protein
MSNGDHVLRGWFGIVTAALRREDLFLRNYLQPYSTGAYEAWRLGIASLYETGIVYLLLRELWRAGYPRALGWEFPFPWSGPPGWKVDLVIFRQRPEESVHNCYPEHVIEVKRIGSGHNISEQLAVWWDLLRLLWFDKADQHRYELLLTIGAEGAPLGKEVEDLLGMRLGGNLEQYTFERLVCEIVNQQVQYRPYYLQHFERVEEVLWEEFDTRLAHNQPGKVRVSLVELFRRE